MTPLLAITGSVLMFIGVIWRIASDDIGAEKPSFMFGLVGCGSIIGAVM